MPKRLGKQAQDVRKFATLLPANIGFSAEEMAKLLAESEAARWLAENKDEPLAP